MCEGRVMVFPLDTTNNQLWSNEDLRTIDGDEF